MRNVGKLLFWVIICEGTGLLATPFTLAAIPVWYIHLHKPFFSPPNLIFGPVWTFLYLCMGVALFLVLQKGWSKQQVHMAAYFFFVQLFLNFFWSLLFFGLRSPILGLIDILVLVLMIIVTLRRFYPLSKIAAYLLVPYLLWVCFATILNTAILLLN